MPSLPPLKADLLLVHAPAVFEFRERRDVYFPFLGTSGDVPITPLYEYFPVGFKTLQRHLGDRGHDVTLLNLASLFVRYPHLPLEVVLESIDAPLVGIDLHWMIHVQGSLELAEQLKRVRPDISVMFGGMSATYYSDELIRYPFIDLVMTGYDTHAPVAELLEAKKSGASLDRVPNLLWKERDGTVRDNGMTHLPDSFACGIDWSSQPTAPKTKGLPIREFLSTQNAGCAYNCPWCGGSRDAFRRIFQRKKAMARKPIHEIHYEFDMMNALDGVEDYHFYSVGSYNKPKPLLLEFLERIGQTPLKSVSFEQFHLTPPDVLEAMAAANKRVTITLSPESHDPLVAKLAGRGVYTNEEMEIWIEKALEAGIHGIDIWFFIGMPEQTERIALENVDYCEHLLAKFAKQNVNPMICPMIPLLDPGSNIFESPDDYGYRLFYRTADEHRHGLTRASLVNRLNYETRWLPRGQLVSVGYRAIRDLMSAKAAHGALPSSAVRRYNANIDDAVDFGRAVHEADSLVDLVDRAHALEALGDEILQRNHKVLFAGVANQAFPINRQVGGRWFDELGWAPDHLDAVSHFHAPTP
jgi:clorobiocin biosynthesis protein CloN6